MNFEITDWHESVNYIFKSDFWLHKSHFISFFFNLKKVMCPMHMIWWIHFLFKCIVSCTCTTNMFALKKFVVLLQVIYVLYGMILIIFTDSVYSCRTFKSWIDQVNCSCVILHGHVVQIMSHYCQYSFTFLIFDMDMFWNKRK